MLLTHISLSATAQDMATEAATPAPLELHQLAAVVRQYRTPLHRYAKTVCANAADADDATQATFIALLESLQLSRPPRSVKAWLFTVVRNFCLGLLRAASRRVSAYSRDNAGDGQAAKQEDQVMVQAALDAIQALNCTEKEVILRRDFLGQSGPEVCKEMALSLAGIKTHLHRARSKVRASLAEPEVPTT